MVPKFARRVRPPGPFGGPALEVVANDLGYVTARKDGRVVYEGDVAELEALLRLAAGAVAEAQGTPP